MKIRSDSGKERPVSPNPELGPSEVMDPHPKDRIRTRCLSHLHEPLCLFMLLAQLAPASQSFHGSQGQHRTSVCPLFLSNKVGV